MNQESRSNIVLIGMPGAGKSTVGVILAKYTSRDFVDTDLLIQISQQQSLQEIVDKRGYIALRGIEEQILLSIRLHNCVIATGGSAAYSLAAMAHLKTNGIVIFLNVDFATLEKRVTDFDTRGIARSSDQSLADLFGERYVLYKKYADLTIDCAKLTPEQICEKIHEELPLLGKSVATRFSPR